MVCKPAYSEPVSKSGNREYGKKGIRHKNTLRCTVGVTLALICVAASRPASGHTVRGVSERGPVRASSNPE